jgi:hypothetical protein
MPSTQGKFNNISNKTVPKSAVTSTMPPKEREEWEGAPFVAPRVEENVRFPASEGRAAPLALIRRHTLRGEDS